MTLKPQKPFPSIPTLKLTDLPPRKWWGFCVSFFKTLEVLIFRVLQVLDLYRPQKSVVAIPSIATPSYTSIQAVVYNGTQEEVLGFKPRRLLHRILKGLPDLESFERLSFQLAAQDSVKTVESSTETRGFIHMNLPWQLPPGSGRMSYLKINPLGVETMVGRVSLGDYEVLSAPVFFLNDQVKWVVISDIDDTIKDTDIAKSVSPREVLRGLFKGHYYRYEPIGGMAELYQKLVDKGGMIVYVTSTPFQLAPFILKFLRESHFPEGPVFLRWLGYGRFGHKWRTLHRLLSNLGPDQKCLLIGDSGEQDLQIYRRLYETYPFNEKVEKILIRHVPGSPIQKPLHEREGFYHTLPELEAQLQTILS